MVDESMSAGRLCRVSLAKPDARGQISGMFEARLKEKCTRANVTAKMTRSTATITIGLRRRLNEAPLAVDLS